MGNFDSNYLYYASEKAIRLFAGIFAPTFYSEVQLEDLVGEFRYKLLRSNSYDPAQGSLGGWIYQAAKRFVLTDLKKESERRKHYVSFESLQNVDSEDYEGYTEYPDDRPEMGYGSETPEDILVGNEAKQRFYASLNDRNRLYLQAEGGGVLFGGDC